MNLEQAIQTALEYEQKIRDLYSDMVEQSTDAAGKRIFTSLRDDEENHVAYLKSRLQQWRDAGKITVEKLESAIPPPEVIAREVGRLNERTARDDRKNEKQMLSKALHLETETSKFYERLVGEMADEGREMFARFLEIENAHIELVQAELDYLSHTGYWFDFKEFDMEGY
jgi:rubrerythrin